MSKLTLFLGSILILLYAYAWRGDHPVVSLALAWCSGVAMALNLADSILLRAIATGRMVVIPRHNPPPEKDSRQCSIK